MLFASASHAMPRHATSTILAPSLNPISPEACFHSYQLPRPSLAQPETSTSRRALRLRSFAFKVRVYVGRDDRVDK